MTKKKKKTTKSKNLYTRSDFNVRPVTKDDKWCKKEKQRMINGKIIPVIKDPKAPQGYLVTIPFALSFDSIILDLNGIIIKSKLYKGDLLLQVYPNASHPKRIYKIVTKTIKISKKRQNFKVKAYTYRRFINICNVGKTPLYKYY